MLRIILSPLQMPQIQHSTADVIRANDTKSVAGNAPPAVWGWKTRVCKTGHGQQPLAGERQ